MGVKLRRLRNERNWSQADTADKLNVSQPAYHLWETDQAQPTVKHLVRISEVFNVDIYELLKGGAVHFPNAEFEGNGCAVSAGATINMQSPTLLENVIKNQEQITRLLETQNRLLGGIFDKEG